MTTKKCDNASKTSLIGVDLFAGAGGFSLAAGQVGINIKVAVEMNKHAASTYRRNFIEGHKNPPILFSSDINEIKFDQLLSAAKINPGDCDILLGGPPCQGFSAHRINDTGVGDPRNDLLIRYFDFVKALKPKAFVVENVPGLLWSRHKKHLDQFLKEAKKAGYTVNVPTLLNAKDYGVPQNRKRVFIVGIRSDIQETLNWPPLPTHFAPDSEEVIKNGSPKWNNAGAAIDKPLPKNDKNAVHMNHSASLIEVFKNTPINGGSRSESGRVLPCHKKHDGHTDVYGRIDPNKPAPTMTTACINPSKGRFVHPTEHHGITARHAARFQMFPDDFIFDGGIIASGVQIGNAVPIGLGRAVLKTVVDFLKKNSK